MSDQNQVQRSSSLEVKDTERAKVVFCTLCGWQRGLVKGATDKVPDECPQCKSEPDKAAKIEDNEGNPIGDIAENFLNGLQSGESLDLELLVSVASPGSQHALRQRLKFVEMMWRAGQTEAGAEGMDMRGFQQTSPEGGSASSVGSSVPGSVPSSSVKVIVDKASIEGVLVEMEYAAENTSRQLDGLVIREWVEKIRKGLTSGA